MIESQLSSTSLRSVSRVDLQRRVNALLNLQADYFQLRLQFYRQLQQLQCNYSSQYESILEQRQKIIEGTSNAEKTLDHRSLSERAIPHFWLTVLKNLDSFDYAVQRRDESCLQYLTDLRCLIHPQGFTFHFHFHPSNPFFIETLLTKSYSIRIELDPNHPYRSYDGPEVDQCQGCSITWRVNHNLTRRIRQKRRRNKLTNEIRSIAVEESVPSFFDFFSPPIIPDGGISDMSDEDQLRLEADIEYGLLLKQRVIPRAILYYTGEALPLVEEMSETSQ